MAYLKTIVRFMVRNPGAAPGSRYEFIPLRDERPLPPMVRNAGTETRPGVPMSAYHSVFRPLRGENETYPSFSSSDFTALDGQGGASEYYLNNIDLDATSSAELLVKVNEVVDTLQRTTTLLNGKRIAKMYASDLSASVYDEARAAGISKEDVFYRHMTGALPVAPLRTLVGQMVGPQRPLVILVELEMASGGSRRKSRRKSRRRKSNRKSRRR